MSDREEGTQGAHGGDRRTARTREALLGAFAQLVHRRRYEEIRVADIVDAADVGRSTFYEHYQGKDDLLIEAMSGILDILADALSEDEGSLGPLEMVLDHFWQVRERARYLLSGPPARHVAPQLTAALAKRITARLETGYGGRGETFIPIELAATQIAEAQFALIRAWLEGQAACPVTELAVGLRRSARGSAVALRKNHE